MEKGILNLLLQESRHRGDRIKIKRELAHILGNLALEDASHSQMVERGEPGTVGFYSRFPQVFTLEGTGRFMAGFNDSMAVPVVQPFAFFVRLQGACHYFVLGCSPR